ncbi:peptidylprolyl isomerase [Flavobacterium noncentrifugens]|uniref:Periplasmic chaperone PpiD n=1 Tax=Flavobacterium noncentrifugens TaxID=1128970 RepID=A0A1G9AYF6_9FLAO|nr:peptidylprolyl isomerase [Flavobacterium noncentrifugens]GEP51611.1 peptidylprolyl isomerase [Flavobacterium noncentrifugens]SDK31740.1 peptidyl-prolyl cis-trans isomerase D [Flavobacterium noncentrifugens]
MAVLSKIRQRSLLLILVIGFCLFAFIIGDLFNKGNFNQSSKYVGSVNGTDISFEDFRVKVSNLEKSGQQMTAAQAVNRVWDQEVSIALLTAQFDKLGIRTGEKHIVEAFKSDQNIGKNPMFLNDAGVFDLNKFKEYFKSNPEQAQFIKDREKDAELNAKYQIYNTLVKAGMYTTTAEGKLKYEMEANKVSFDYVAVLYSTIKDSDVKIADQDIVDYMKKNEKRYKADENREIEYVLVEDKPSVEDETEVKSSVNALLGSRVEYNKTTGKNDTLPGFKGAANVAEFVNANSDVPYDSTYVAKKDLPADVAEALFNLPTGELYGPYMRGQYYAISKSMGRKAGANAKASHILISYEGTQVPNKKEKRTKEEAKAKAEALLAQVQANPSSFLMLALTNSDDSSAQQGGDLGYFSQGQMVKPFNDFVFNNPIGKIGLVETDFGFHIINITDKQDAIRLATIARKIEPSEGTTDRLYTKAVKFEMDANDKDFEKTAKAEGLTVNPSVKVKAMDEMVGALGAQRQIVRWAYEKGTNAGDVKRFEVANLGNVIAKLKKVNKEGLMSVEDARPSVEPVLKNKKKAEKIKAKMAGSTLDAVAKATGSTVQQAVDLTIDNGNLPGAGPEKKVVGTAFAIGVNKVSAPIEGNSGVYVVKPTAITKAPVLKDYKDYSAKVKAQVAGYSGRVIPALKSDADIKDNRADFNY